MAHRKIKKPTLTQEVQALKISTNLMAQEMATLTPRLREQTAQLGTIRSAINELKNNPDLIERQEPTINQEQLNQLAMAVNKIAAYAAAMDETKKTMIKLTSQRIDKLSTRVAKLRVRLRRLEE